ncbi:protein singles bar [Linepithema humile]|uniref:protein singles bar n=1 Tax=Linepithema humile TaxID=83485 RepID=UPI0006237457|nr:PREDICTED: uncharacterized protein LOC105672696 [Linepithema humile]
MAHSMTIRTQQTVTTTGSTIVINTGHLKSWSGILKLLQLAMGIVCVGIIGNEYPYASKTEEPFFFVITTTFMIGTFILLLSCLISFSTAAIISKTIYEFIYHFIASLLIFSASLTLLVHVTNYRRSNLLLTAAICGLINTALYICSTIFAFRNYRGA